MSDTDRMWNDSEEFGIVATSVTKMKTLAVKVDTLEGMRVERVTLMGRINGS
jgi:hypothetical protein